MDRSYTTSYVVSIPNVDPKVTFLHETPSPPSNELFDTLCPYCTERIDKQYKMWDISSIAEQLFVVVRYGHLPCIRWLLDRIGDQITPQTIRKAIENAAWNGHLDCLDHLIDRFGISAEGKEKVVAYAVLGSQLLILERASALGYPAPPLAYYYGTLKTNWPVYEYLLDHFTPTKGIDYAGILENAIRSPEDRAPSEQVPETSIHRKSVQYIPHPFTLSCSIPGEWLCTRTPADQSYWISQFVEKCIKPLSEPLKSDLIKVLLREIHRNGMNKVSWDDGWWYALLREYSHLTQPYFLLRAKCEEMQSRILQELEQVYRYINVPGDLIRYEIQSFL